MDYLLGIDIGTSGTKTLITDIEGNIVALSLIHISEPTRPY